MTEGTLISPAPKEVESVDPEKAGGFFKSVDPEMTGGFFESLIENGLKAEKSIVESPCVIRLYQMFCDDVCC